MRRRTMLPVLLLLTLAGPARAVETQARAEPSAPEARTARGDALLALKKHLAVLASDDAEAREQAQDALIELGASFRDKIEAALASARTLEVRTRLAEVLEAWTGAAGYAEYLDYVNSFRSSAPPSSVPRSSNSPSTLRRPDWQPLSYAQHPTSQTD